MSNRFSNAQTSTSLVANSIRAMSAAMVIGSMAVTFGLSFAAIIYTGPLAPFLSQGIGLILLGATIMALIAPMVLTYRGSLMQPQDMCAILFSLCAATIATMPDLNPEVAFATVVVMIGATSVLTGIAAFAMGHFRLGYLVRFVPFPVIGGFLAASGALLFKSAFGMAAPDVQSLTGLIQHWPLWAPWLGVGIGVLAVARLSDNKFGIPLALVASLAGFYGITALLGQDLPRMRDLGLLLGPFQSTSFISGIDPRMATQVDWPVLLTQLPVMVAIVGISALGMLLNASGLEVAIEREIDFERDLKGVGLANVIAGFAGGMVGYHTLSETLLARRFGVVGIGAGLSVAVVTGFALFFGAGVLSYLPIGLFAAVVWFLGFDLILTAVRDQGRMMPRLELGIVLVMPAIALIFGFMPAVGFGILMAVLLFVIAYSRVDVTRISTTAANFHARVERSPADVARLVGQGDLVRIDRLDGFLFFGSASRLVERLQQQVSQSPNLRHAIVDMAAVVGLDMSAWVAFERLGRSCRLQGVDLVITGLSPALKARFGGQGRETGGHFRVAGSLDDTLMTIENALLADSCPAVDGESQFGLGRDAARILQHYGTSIQIAKGEALIVQGARSDHLMFLVSGQLQATVTDRNQADRIVSRFLPGAIVGEIAFYAGVSRTATITAETPATIVRMDAASLTAMEQDDPATAARFHRALATVLAGRLMTTTRLLNDAEL